AEQWYDGLLLSLASQLDLDDEMERFWDENQRLGPLQRFMAAIERCVLAREGSEFRVRGSESRSGPTRNPELRTRNSTQRAVIFVDEIDAVRSLPFPADEFFAAVRECYNRRAQDPAFQRLTFCLLGVATPADLISDTRMS